MAKESVFLGTSAAEMNPNPFCKCEVCQTGREAQEARLRSAFWLDETMVIDFGPDVAAASLVYHAPLCEVEHVLITHTHEDHFDSAAFSVMTMSAIKKPIQFYVSEEALDWINKLIALEKHVPGTFGYMLDYLQNSSRIQFNTMKTYESYELSGKMVIPLKTNHPGYGDGEFGFNYLIRWERGNWLYASDSGRYPEENFEYLKAYVKEHGPLDTVIFEGTYGNDDTYNGKSHMSARLLVGEMQKYIDFGLFHENTRIYITHINPVQTFTAEQYQEYLREQIRANIMIARDGMRI